MRATTWLTVCGLGILGACGGAPEPVAEPGLKPVELTDPVVRPAPAEPEEVVDAGPGGVPASAVVARVALFPKGRWIRCALPVGVAPTGDLAAVSLKGEVRFLDAPDVSGGWFSATVPFEDGAASILADGKVVGRVIWQEALRGGWTDCEVWPIGRYELLGLVETPEEKPVVGAEVRGCERGVIVRTNAEGRFSIQAPMHHPCAVMAFVQDKGGLGASETALYHSDEQRIGEEGGAGAAPDMQNVTFAELVIGPERLTPDMATAEAARLHQVLELRTRNGVRAELERLEAAVAAAELEPAVAGVAARWIGDLRARVAEVEGQIEALKTSGTDGMLFLWRTEIR